MPPFPETRRLGRGPVWLSTWLSRRPNLAGMDGNRTHPGRLNSAPQTVLKTADLPSTNVRWCPLKTKSHESASADVRWRLPTSGRMAVILAVRTSAAGTDPLVFALAVSDDNFLPMIDPTRRLRAAGRNTALT
jgi:hypothetical protein